MTTRPRARRAGPAKRIPVRTRAAVSRAEFNRLTAQFNERADILNALRADQDIQFQRLAQLQAELDLIRRAWERLRLGAS